MPPGRLPAGATRWLTIAFALAALAQVALTVWAAWDTRHELPRWDDGWLLRQDLLLEPGELGLTQLFSQQSEHRIPFPRLFFRADLMWADGSGAFLVTSLLLLQLIHVAVLVAISGCCRAPALLQTSRVALGKPGLERQVIAGSIATLMLFSCNQLENFNWRVQISSILVYLTASLSLWALLAWHQRVGDGQRHSSGGALPLTRRWWTLPGPWFGVISLVSAFVANYSRADGNLIWPLIGLVAWRLALPRRFLCVLAACGVASVTFCFWDYTTPVQQTAPWTVLVHGLPRATVYFFVFLGAQASTLGVTAAGAAGTIGVLVAAVYVVGVATRRLDAPAGVGLVAVLLFAAGSGAVTALGRSVGPLESALTYRYATPALLFWAALLMLVIDSLTRRVPASRRLRVLAWSALIFFVGLGLAGQATVIEGHRAIARDLERATMALLSRVCDIPAFNFFSPPRPDFAETVELLRQHRGWFLPTPDRGPVCDSWAGRDGNQGRCVLGPCRMDGTRGLGVPVLVGPDAGGQAVRIRDADSGQALATLEVAAFRGCWRVWHFALADGVSRSVVVEAEDRGSDWGQWLALGRLHWLR